MELELYTYDESWIQRKGGVAWVKQVAAAMDPGAVGLQITGYQQAAEQIAYAQKALKTTQGNLDASWTGQAATAAQQTFQGSVDHAQVIQDTINEDIVPHLTTVQQAQQEFIDRMMNVPDEKPLTQEALHYLGWKDIMNFPPNYPGKVLIEHNTAARTQAAAALTTCRYLAAVPLPVAGIAKLVADAQRVDDHRFVLRGERDHGLQVGGSTLRSDLRSEVGGPQVRRDGVLCEAVARRGEPVAAVVVEGVGERAAVKRRCLYQKAEPSRRVFGRCGPRAAVREPGHADSTACSTRPGGTAVGIHSLIRNPSTSAVNSKARCG